MREFEDGEILGAYYDAVENGGLNHERGMQNVIRRVAGEVNTMDRVTVERVVRETFENTTGPEFLHPTAVSLIGEMLAAGAVVSICTVGDHGERSHYYQEKKIEDSRVFELVTDYLCREKGIERVEAVALLGNLRVDITREYKQEKIREVMMELYMDGIDKIYFADDKWENIEAVRPIVPQLPIEYQEWCVKQDEDWMGNLTAFHEFMKQEMRGWGGKRVAVILDWDDTLTYEIPRMQVIRRRINERLGKR